MTLPDEVRANCARIVANARSVHIDIDALERFEGSPQATIQPVLEGSGDEVARALLITDAINFGSGWFPTLRKRPGHSGYGTVAAALREHFSAQRPVDQRRIA